MRSTQLNSWQQLQPTLSTRQCQVLEAIVKLGGKATNRQIAKCLSWEINRVTGRITELVGLGLVGMGVVAGYLASFNIKEISI